MTDWYVGHDGSDVAVLEDQEYFDRLPSPDSWLQWDTCGIQGNSGWENSFDSGNLANEKPQQRMLFGKAGNKGRNQGDGGQSYDSSDFGVPSQDSHSLLRNSAASARPDYYFNDLTGTDPTDDIFLSSFLQDDVLPIQSLYIAMPSDNDSTKKMVDLQNSSCETDRVGRLKCFSNPNFSFSRGSEDGNSHGSKGSSGNSSDQSSPSVKVLENRNLIPSEYEPSRTMLEGNDMSSVEESVLMGLEAVLNQLNDETRLCLRDSMYRLANHSDQQTPKNNLVEDLSMGEPSLPETSDVPSSSSIMETTESETNAIDRAVAYLMFNKTDPNVQDLLPAWSPEFMHSGNNFVPTGDFTQQMQGQSHQSHFGSENAF